MKVMFSYRHEPDGRFLGYLNDYPDHWTQGDDLVDLQEHLLDLHRECTDHEIPGIRKIGELEVV